MANLKFNFHQTFKIIIFNLYLQLISLHLGTPQKTVNIDQYLDSDNPILSLPIISNLNRNLDGKLPFFIFFLNYHLEALNSKVNKDLFQNQFPLEINILVKIYIYILAVLLTDSYYSATFDGNFLNFH